MDYPENLSIREAREIYFAKSGFDARTYTDAWVKLPFLGFHFYLPNFSARKKAVPLHDIDHVLTEYKTDWLGEFEISAYELGTGCGRYWAGWIINSQGVLPGVILAPRKLLHAFARGRRSRGVYAFADYESLLSESVGDLRRRTTTAHGSVQPTLIDGLHFGLVVLTSAIVHLGPIVGLLWWLLRWEFIRVVERIMKYLKYALFVMVLGSLTFVVYKRFLKKPRLYSGWPIVQKHSCVYGAYYFSYLFKTSLDSSKVNAECTQQVNSEAASSVEKGLQIGFYCGRGSVFPYDKNIPAQRNFLKASKDDVLSEERAKMNSLVALCIRAVEQRFDPLHKELNAASEFESIVVEPPPRDLYREFSILGCEVAKSPPCFD